jgi:hypothetical protein
MEEFMFKHITTAGLVALAVFCGSQTAAAQTSQTWTAPSTIETGTALEIRMTEPIDTQAVDGRVFTATVDSDVLDTQGRLAIPSGGYG